MLMLAYHYSRLIAFFVFITLNYIPYKNVFLFNLNLVRMEFLNF